ncbi:MAG: vanadium-dependent haloperoxidase [Marinisporobacter sp.]|jgi:hypothetical protein|nr:vanadium-dependent haloperoxidase [Marinisporobacter sp.]
MIEKNDLNEKKQITKEEESKKEVANINLDSGNSCEIGPLTARQRREKAFQIRQNAALFQKNMPVPSHPCNGDEELYPNKIGNFSKSLPHNKLGEVSINAYKVFIKALMTGNPDTFEDIPLGGVVKLANPQASYAFDLVGPDSHHLNTIVPPSFSSAWLASEMAEDYWSALTRDVPFIDYDTNNCTIAAASDLSKFSDFRGPKQEGAVTTKTLFRGNTPGDLAGPYISQFFYENVPFGNKTIIQRYYSPKTKNDYMTSYNEWLNIQNGVDPNISINFEHTRRYIRNGRDLGQWVHVDFTYQGMLTACLILLSFGQKALDPENPYLCSKTQVGFITFGAAQILDLVAKATRVALEAAWFQKFLVHRMLRPEEFGGCVQNNLTGATKYPIHSELFNSKALSKVFSKFGTYLLPMAYPEGCPTHPSYPAGHACVAGAGATMLKAFFNESFIISNPVVASADGLSLVPYVGEALTIGGELNKLASNIAIGRNLAGVHWRVDGSEGLKLGEKVAIRILQDYKNTNNEDFSGFSLTKFDGTTIII